MMLFRQYLSTTTEYKEHSMGTARNKTKQRITFADLRNELPAPLDTLHKEDALHRKPSEENLAYWTREHAKADDADEDRIRECAAARREILLRIVPHEKDEAGEILGAVLTEFDMIPRTH
jgi:hypothetical protein